MRWLAALALALVSCGGPQQAKSVAPGMSEARFQVRDVQQLSNLGDLYVICDTQDHQLLYATTHGITAKTVATETEDEC